MGVMKERIEQSSGGSNQSSGDEQKVKNKKKRKYYQFYNDIKNSLTEMAPISTANRSQAGKRLKNDPNSKQLFSGSQGTKKRPAKAFASEHANNKT